MKEGQTEDLGLVRFETSFPGLLLAVVLESQTGSRFNPSLIMDSCLSTLIYYCPDVSGKIIETNPFI